MQDHPTKHSLVAGKPEQSELYIRVSSKDTSILMPKPSSRLARLTDRELAIIKKWISQGAVYEPHWAFVVPKKKPLPNVNNKQWPINEIDYFILKKMESKGLEPNEIAEK